MREFDEATFAATRDVIYEELATRFGDWAESCSEGSRTTGFRDVARRFAQMIKLRHESRDAESLERARVRARVITNGF